MDFGFSEQQRDVQQLARQILSKQVTPEKLAAYDEFASPRFDRELWQQLAAAGLLGVAVPESHGGMGFGFLELALLAEEAGRCIAPVPLIAHAASAAMALRDFGSDAQREQWLPGAADGSVLLSAALVEGVDEDPVQPTLTRAVRDDQGFRLTGTKACVPFAADAERVLVAAATAEGVAVMLVDPRAEGVSLTPLKYTTYEPLFQMSLDSVTVPAAEVLAGPESGADLMCRVAEYTTVAVCAHQLGLTDQAMRMTASYTAERQQFGVAIATFQAVGHRAANCFIDVECLRLTTYQAASRLDAGLEAASQVDIAKIWAGDVGHRVSYAAQHLHGGTGIDRDYPLWRYCLWARHNETLLGGSARRLASLGEHIAAGRAYCY